MFYGHFLDTHPKLNSSQRTKKIKIKFTYDIEKNKTEQNKRIQVFLQRIEKNIVG